MSLTSLDLSNWDFSSCTSASNLINGTTKLMELKVPTHVTGDFSIPNRWYEEDGKAIDNCLPIGLDTSKLIHRNEFTIMFNKNGGTGSMMDAHVGKNLKGDTYYTLPSCSFKAPSGKKFIGWSLNKSDIISGSTIKLTESITLTAMYGCSVHETPTLVKGKPATAVYDGYKDAYCCPACKQYFEDQECSTAIPNYTEWKNGAGKLDRLDYTPEIRDLEGNLVPSGEGTWHTEVRNNGAKYLVIYANNLVLKGALKLPVSLEIESGEDVDIFYLDTVIAEIDVNAPILAMPNDTKLVITGDCVIDNISVEDKAQALSFSNQVEIATNEGKAAKLEINTFNCRNIDGSLVIDGENLVVEIEYFFVPTLTINEGTLRLTIGGGCCCCNLNGGAFIGEFGRGTGLTITDDRDVLNKGKLIITGGKLSLSAPETPFAVIAFTGIEVPEGYVISGSNGGETDDGEVIQINYSGYDVYTFGSETTAFNIVDVKLHDHVLSFVEGHDATCKECGYADAYECTICNQYFEDEHGLILIGDEDAYNAWKVAGGKLDPLGHNMTKVDGLAPTESEPGYKDAYYCGRCETYFEDEAGTIVIGNTAAYEAWKLNEGKLPVLPKSGLPVGAIVGIVLGSLVFLLLVLFVVLYILWKKKDIKPLRFLVVVFRKINKLLFKTPLNDVEKEKEESKDIKKE